MTETVALLPPTTEHNAPHESAPSFSDSPQVAMQPLSLDSLVSTREAGKTEGLSEVHAEPSAKPDQQAQEEFGGPGTGGNAIDEDTGVVWAEPANGDIPRRHQGIHRRGLLGGHVGKHTKKSVKGRANVGEAPKVVGISSVLNQEGQAEYPKPQREGESLLAWSIRNGATKPGDATKMLRGISTGGSRVYSATGGRERGKHRAGGREWQGYRINYPTPNQLTEAVDADKRLAVFSEMESSLQTGGRLPYKDEIYRRLFPDRQVDDDLENAVGTYVGGHRREGPATEDSEVVDAVMSRLERIEDRRLASAVGDFANQGITPSEQELVERLHPGRSPEDLSTAELRDINTALQNISESYGVRMAVTEELRKRAIRDSLPTPSEIKKKLFPYRHDSSDAYDRAEVDTEARRVMDWFRDERIEAVTREFVAGGKRPFEREIRERLFGVWYPGSLSGKDNLAVTIAEAKIAGRIAEPLPTPEGKRQKVGRIAKVVGAAAMAVSMAATNIFGVQATGPTHPSVSAPVVATRISSGVPVGRQTTSQPR